MAKILLVEDDVALSTRVSEWLKFQQHVVDVVHDGKEGADRLKLYEYDIAILDWELPLKAGVDVCKHYRAAGGKIPILMLTGKSQISDKEEGLDSGADDYLTKPFDLKELSARLRALLRRPAIALSSELKVHDIILDDVSKKVTKAGVEVDLSPKELQLLEFFLRHPDQVFSQEALLERIWSSESEASVFSVYTAVKTLRKKMTKAGEKPFLATVHGLGYRLNSE
jgi:OmpR-family two-component system manganese-sensing response regulator